MRYPSPIPFSAPSRRARAYRLVLASAARRLTVWCAFALVFALPRLSHAAAPFCDPSGASMIAPVPALPNQTGELRAPPTNCDETTRDFVAASRTRHDVPAAERILTPPERVLPTRLAFPEIHGSVIPVPPAPDDIALPGHPHSIYRPPRG
jgi:hypothetical protein